MRARTTDDAPGQGRGKPSGGDTITVLHVDDDADMRRMLAYALPTIHKALPAAGWPSVRVIEAEDGPTGVEKAREHMPDVILMDLLLARVNGLMVTIELRRDPRTSHIPVILLTVFKDDRMEKAARRLGVQRVMYKPFHWDELMRAIVEVTDHHG